MEFLFPDLNFEGLKVFIYPTNVQIKDWLTQTSGKLSNKLCKMLNFPCHEKDDVVYTGSLTLEQQIWIYHDLIYSDKD